RGAAQAGTSASGHALAGTAEESAGFGAERLAAMPEPEREQFLLDLVRDEAADVLGHSGATAVRSERTFQELGFDSLTGVDLRNRLSAATGLRLPTTLVFDHPNPAELTAFLAAGLASHPVGPDPAPDPGPHPEPDRDALLAELDRTEALLSGLAPDDPLRTEASERLRAMQARIGPAAGPPPTDGASDQTFAAASADDIFDFIDNELGRAAS